MGGIGGQKDETRGRGVRGAMASDEGYETAEIRERGLGSQAIRTAHTKPPSHNPPPRSCHTTPWHAPPRMQGGGHTTDKRKGDELDSPPIFPDQEKWCKKEEGGKGSGERKQGAGQS